MVLGFASLTPTYETYPPGIVEPDCRTAFLFKAKKARRSGRLSSRRKKARRSGRLSSRRKKPVEAGGSLQDEKKPAEAGFSDSLKPVGT
jgi:hypothetical protein